MDEFFESAKDCFLPRSGGALLSLSFSWPNCSTEYGSGLGTSVDCTNVWGGVPGRRRGGTGRRDGVLRRVRLLGHRCRNPRGHPHPHRAAVAGFSSSTSERLSCVRGRLSGGPVPMGECRRRLNLPLHLPRKIPKWLESSPHSLASCARTPPSRSTSTAAPTARTCARTRAARRPDSEIVPGPWRSWTPSGSTARSPSSPAEPWPRRGLARALGEAGARVAIAGARRGAARRPSRTASGRTGGHDRRHRRADVKGMLAT